MFRWAVARARLSDEQAAILVRGDSLAARMSRYLIKAINRAPNIDVRWSLRSPAPKARKQG